MLKNKNCFIYYKFTITNRTAISVAWRDNLKQTVEIKLNLKTHKLTRLQNFTDRID